MAFRLSFAFCFLAALGVVLTGMCERHRRHDRMETGDWIARANAAAISADDRTAVPILVGLLDDANPRVRMNACWALNRLTGLPWSSRVQDCKKWWTDHRGDWSKNRQVPGLEPYAPDSSSTDWERLGLAVRPTDEPPRLDVVLYVREGGPVRLHVTVVEQYAAFLYGGDGRIARVLDDEEPGSAMLEIRIYDSDGNRIGRYWWPLDREVVAPDAPLIRSCETASLEPGNYVAEVFIGRAVLSEIPSGEAGGIFHPTIELEAARMICVFRR